MNAPLDKQPLGREQRRIIAAIKRLHRRNEPLNVTAVKRHHPELMESAYRIKPFWGWKQALRDAGIDYRKIKTELLDFIECPLCKKHWKNLANHLIPKHEVRLAEFRMDYPDLDLICETQRARIMRVEKPPIPHWEHVWSREYALDRLAEYYRRGDALHSSKLMKMDASLCMAIPRYVANGLRGALRLIGLDPKEVTRQGYIQLRRYPNKEAVLARILERQRRGMPLLSHKVMAAHGREPPDCGLVTSAQDYYGSWQNALKAAHIDPLAVHRQESTRFRFRTPGAILQAIRTRIKRKIPVNLWSLYHGQHTDITLAIRANEYYGSWTEALKRAGVDPASVSKAMRCRSMGYDNKAAMVCAIQRYKAEGHPLNTNAMLSGSLNERSLFFRCQRSFGSWRRALAAAGIDPDI